MDRTLFLPVNVVFLTVFLPLATAWGVQSGSGTQGGAHRSGPGVCTLALGPMAATEEAEQLRLLPELEGQSAKDAYPIYQEAISVLGPGVPFRQILDWLKVEGPAFPMEEALQTLAPYESVLVLLERASKCSQCNWPKIKVGVMVPHLTEMRYLIALVALQARIHIEERRFSEAAVALQAGMALTRHLGQAPLVIQGTVAMAMEGVLCRQLRHWVQAPGSPSLYGPIAALPPSLVDIDKQIQYELDNMSFLQRLMFKRTMKQTLGPVHARVRFMQKRANRDLLAIQTVESLRHHAADHQGQFPQALADLEWPVPNDPTTGKPFAYRQEEGTAIIESVPKEGGPKESLQYTLKWR